MNIDPQHIIAMQEKYFHLGWFKDKEAAIAARKTAEKIYR